MPGKRPRKMVRTSSLSLLSHEYATALYLPSDQQQSRWIQPPLFPNASAENSSFQSPSSNGVPMDGSTATSSFHNHSHMSATDFKLRSPYMQQQDVHSPFQENKYVAVDSRDCASNTVEHRVGYGFGAGATCLGHNLHSASESPWSYGVGLDSESWQPPAYATCQGSSQPDFLRSCNHCKRSLDHGDIFMYRGEKAFCSHDCRQQQIHIDERRSYCAPAPAGRRFSMVPSLDLIPAEQTRLQHPVLTGTCAAA